MTGTTEPLLTGAVLHVRDLDRAVDFYARLLGLQVARRETDAALLASSSGRCQLGLRQRSSQRSAGTVQALIWTVDDQQVLDEYEQRLRALGAASNRHESEDGVTIFATQDADSQRILLVHRPAGTDMPAHIPVEVFAY
jgi:catechol 2,3-dioxygenase-like lactoylglutathione lyase family enzyme